MQRNVVVNADDFGMTAGVSRGIARAYDEGIVTSASLLATFAGFDVAASLARARPGLGVGLHLDVTDGTPVLPPDKVPTLVDADGRFLGYRTFTLRLLSARISRDELRAEVAAQIGRCRAAGLKLTHLDGHRHAHLLPVLFDIVADAAVQAGIPQVRCPAAVGERARPAGIKAARALGFAGFARIQYGRLLERGLSTSDCFLGLMGQGSGETLRETAARLAEMPAGLTEWMVHPGEVDDALLLVDDYLWGRQEELAWLTSDEARAAVAASGAILVDFAGRPKLLAVEGEVRSVA